jgi:hypothetical protein
LLSVIRSNFAAAFTLISSLSFAMNCWLQKSSAGHLAMNVDILASLRTC